MQQPVALRYYVSPRRFSDRHKSDFQAKKTSAHLVCASKIRGGMVKVRLQGLSFLRFVGLVFGLLLALVTGREHVPDPLLDLDSTGGDVSLELDD